MFNVGVDLMIGLELLGVEGPGIRTGSAGTLALVILGDSGSLSKEDSLVSLANALSTADLLRRFLLRGI